MKTVKIILKFKFLTLFSDKIIQCYTESTVYTIITLFLYGIGAIILCFKIITHIVYYIIPIWNWSESTAICITATTSITLFLYGIGALKICFNSYLFSLLHYSYMELELIQTQVFLKPYRITLFLYGIGA